MKYIEVLGLLENGNGRACPKHSVCGSRVIVGSLLVLLPVAITNGQNENEYAIAAVILENGTPTCTVGFVGREFHYFREQYENKLAQVSELLLDSTNSEHRRRAHINRRIAVSYLLN
jgi:hypothetical protein